MDMTLVRKEHRKDGIFSALIAENGTTFETLEHSYNLLPKLPPGEYKCVRGPHRLHSGPLETFEIMGVKGHSGILFHIGNYQKDSDGCVLVGGGIAQAPGGDQIIVKSKIAFAAFLELQKDVNEFQLTVR